MLGLSTLILKQSYLIFSNFSRIINPIIILIIGLSLLNIIEVSIYTPSQIKMQNFMINSLAKTYVVGLSIGFNISPCTTPILMTLIAWISTTQQILTGFFFLSIYSIGYITPIIIILISFNNIKNINLINPIWYNIVPLSGSVVVATGTFSLLRQLFSSVTL